MSYLTDDEHRILLASLRREKEFCSRQMTDSKRLVKIVQSLEQKFYYDRFEKEIRNKAIDEFAERVIDIYHELPTTLGYTEKIIREIAEQMKGVVDER